jgi:hypothetical protein
MDLRCQEVDKGIPAFIFRESVEEAEAYAIQEDRAGIEEYLAQSSFKTKENRKQKNVQAGPVRSGSMLTAEQVAVSQSDRWVVERSISSVKRFAFQLLRSLIHGKRTSTSMGLRRRHHTPTMEAPLQSSFKKLCAALGLHAARVEPLTPLRFFRPVGTRNKKKDPEARSSSRS